MELKKYKQQIFSVINILMVVYFIVFLVCEKNEIHIPFMEMVKVLLGLYLIAKILDIIQKIKEKQKFYQDVIIIIIIIIIMCT